MPNVFTSETFASTYKDDYLDSDNYYRILFNSGRALQARELTQMQTIIQEEIARLGRHLFKEGSNINPGGITVNTNYEFIKLNTTTNQLPTNYQNLVGVELTSDLGISFVVLEVIPAENGDPATLFVRYTDTSAGTSGSTAIRVEAGGNISGGINPEIDEDEEDRSFNLTVQSTNTTTNPAVGKGTRLSFHAGDFFAEKHFVFAPSQNLIISKYTTNPTVKVGFKVIRDIITVSDKDELYDNTGATPNLASPGADRFRIRLEIATEDSIASDDNFIIIATVRNGVVFSEIGLTKYNRLDDYLALRTKEESGNYIVKPFDLSFDTNDSDNSKLDFVVSPGIAYIDGYRAATQYETIISVDKPRDVVTRNNQVVAANYGNYVLATDQRGMPNINTLEQYDLKPDSDYGVAQAIGSARIRHISEDGSNYKLYLTDIQMDPGQSFRDVKSIGDGPNDYFNLKPENGKTVIKDSKNNNLLFELPLTRPQSLSDIVLTVQRRIVTNTDGAGNASFNLTNTSEVFVDADLWITSEDSSAADSPTITINPSNLRNVTISGGTPDADVYEIISYVQKSAGVIRNKTLVERTDTIAADSSTVPFLNLTKADIFEFVSIKDGDSDGADISGIFRQDNGQRDNFYALGKLHRLGEDSVPPNVFVRYKYFSHNPTGDFFAVNSYTGQVSYEDIPNFTKADGSVINLRDVLDFRPVQDANGQFSTSPAIVNELPRPTDTITFDASYYVGQSAKLSINREGEIALAVGSSSVNPQLPKTPENSLDLYNITMKPYVVDDQEDVTAKRLNYKRFTMADIGRLERRVSDLEDVTALTLLELETSSFEVLDAQGLPRTKSGFFVDNFRNQSKSFTSASDHRAAIDPKTKTMRPSFSSLNVALSYDSDREGNTGVVLKGDNVYLNYHQVSYMANNFMTGTENVNPFAVVVRKGILTLSPESDEWFDVEFVEPKVIDGGFAQGNVNGQLWDDWNWNWSGASADDFQIGAQLGDIQAGNIQLDTANAVREGRTTTTPRFRIDNFVRIEGIRDVPTWIDEEGVEVSRVLLPKMRSRLIAFKAEGLRPNTQHFAFFGQTPVDDWVRETSFVTASQVDSDWGSGFGFATEHPNGKSTLISDPSGAIEGSFFLPNTSSLSFDVGEKPFTLIDISALNPEDCTSIAATPYSSAGYLVHKQQTVLSTRTIDLSVESRRNNAFSANVFTEPEPERRQFNFDPLAQTFLVEEKEGVFITGVKLRFKTKDSEQVPVVVQLRPATNGAPSSDTFVPGSTVVKSPAQVFTSDDGSQVTTFEFDEPVYLTGNEEYAIVIITNSVEYLVYVAEAGEYLLGSTEARLTRQATLGSLFKSQNARIWEPDQTKDLTFELMRAEFDISGTVYFENKDTPSVHLLNKMKTTGTSNKVYVDYPNHGFVVSDRIYINQCVAVGGINQNDLIGLRDIDEIDGFGFTFVAGAAATSTATGGGEIVLDRQSQMHTFYTNVENILPPGTTLNLSARFVTGQSFAGAETAYQTDPNYMTIPNRRNVYFDSPRLLASRVNEFDQITNQERSVRIKCDLTTNSGLVSPVVDMQRTSMTAFANRIDKQLGGVTPSNGGNVDHIINYVPETSPNGGTAQAKHLTNPITLAEKAVGIKVMFAANKPPTSTIELWYRTNSGGTDSVLDENWILATIEEEMPTDDNPYVYRDYRFLLGGIDGTLDDFDIFQLKIVMKSENACKVPTFKDLRAIALTV